MSAYVLVISDDNIYGNLIEHFDTFDEAAVMSDSILNSAGSWIDLSGGAVLLNDPGVALLPTGEAEALGLIED